MCTEIGIIRLFKVSSNPYNVTWSSTDSNSDLRILSDDTNVASIQVTEEYVNLGLTEDTVQLT